MAIPKYGCWNCRFLGGDLAAELRAGSSAKTAIAFRGQCRRYPPAYGKTWGWPHVVADEWCGEWKPVDA